MPIVAVAPEEQRPAVREFLEHKADPASIERAFTDVLAAAKEPGVKNVELRLDGPQVTFGSGESYSSQPTESLQVTAHLEVNKNLEVNGGALPCDKDLRVGAAVAQWAVVKELDDELRSALGAHRR